MDSTTICAVILSGILMGIMLAGIGLFCYYAFQIGKDIGNWLYK